MLLVFDLDETLISTRRASLEAYHSCGVEPPADFHTRPWQEWCSYEDHEAKQDALPRFLPLYVEFLPCYHMIYRFTGGIILTNAARRSIETLYKVLPETRDWNIISEMKPAMKFDWLSSREPGIYFDDNTLLVDRLRRETRWQAIDTSRF